VVARHVFDAYPDYAPGPLTMLKVSASSTLLGSRTHLLAEFGDYEWPFGGLVCQPRSSSTLASCTFSDAVRGDGIRIPNRVCTTARVIASRARAPPTSSILDWLRDAPGPNSILATCVSTANGEADTCGCSRGDDCSTVHS
jgi:hypothetical protein